MGMSEEEDESGRFCMAREEPFSMYMASTKWFQCNVCHNSSRSCNTSDDNDGLNF